YLEIDVRTEGEFLSVEHTRVTTEEFIGNSYRLEYFLDVDKLHEGSNFGRIILESPYETLTYEVVVEKDVKWDAESRAKARELAGMIRNDLKSESGKMEM